MQDDIMASSSNPTLRPEFVENARRFFKNPKINSTPLDEQRKFLLEKGVTQAEIDAALDSVPEIELAANKSAVPIYYQTPPPVPPQNTIMNVAQSTVIIAGSAYMAYKFVRSWILPKLFDIADPADEDRRELHTQLNELQNATKFIMDSTSQCSDAVQAQQEQLNRALTLISNNGKGVDWTSEELRQVLSLFRKRISTPPNGHISHKKPSTERRELPSNTDNEQRNRLQRRTSKQSNQTKRTDGDPGLATKQRRIVRFVDDVCEQRGQRFQRERSRKLDVIIE